MRRGWWCVVYYEGFVFIELTFLDEVFAHTLDLLECVNYLLYYLSICVCAGYVCMYVCMYLLCPCFRDQSMLIEVAFCFEQFDESKNLVGDEVVIF